MRPKIVKPDLRTGVFAFLRDFHAQVRFAQKRMLRKFWQRCNNFLESKVMP
jgi:hypothetical protein